MEDLQAKNPHKKEEEEMAQRLTGRLYFEKNRYIADLEGSEDEEDEA